MYRTAQRLRQHGGLIGHLIGHVVKLAFMGDQLCAPASAGVAAVARLNAGRDVSLHHPLTVAVVPFRTWPAHLLKSSDRTPQCRLQHHPLIHLDRVHLRAHLGHTPCHLMAGNKGRGEEGGEVDTTATGCSRHVRPADTAEHGQNPYPGGSREVGLRNLCQPQKKHLAWLLFWKTAPPSKRIHTYRRALFLYCKASIL